MTKKTDILIIGAGPTGLTTALELKRRGFDPIIIDDDGVPTPQSRALAIHARTLDILEPSGVSKNLIEAGNKVERIKLFQNDVQRMQLEFSDLPHRFAFILVLPQSRTEEILIDALFDLGTPIHWHHKLLSIEKNKDGFACKITANDREQTIQTKHLIGADGARSLVRNSLGFCFEGESKPETWSLADVTFEQWPHPYDCAIANIRDGKIGGFFPISQGNGRFVSAQPNVLANLPPGTAVAKVGWQSDFKISYRQVDTYQKENAFLVGDAAHIHSPMGGRGMNLGIEDAAYLAWLFKTGNTDKYTNYRHPIGKKVLAFTKQQTNFLVNGGWKRDLALRYLAPLAMSFKAVRKRALVQMTGLDTPAPPWL